MPFLPCWVFCRKNSLVVLERDFLRLRGRNFGSVAWRSLCRAEFLRYAQGVYMQGRFDGFTSGERLILELALNELGDYFTDMICRYPKCPDVEYWRERLLYISKLQHEILDSLTEKSRSA